MTKNMTQRGLAIGAGLALIASGVAAVPASATGQADTSLVSLVPNEGTQYSVLSDNFFDLKANSVASIATTGNLKFLVEDTAAVTKFDLDVDGTPTNNANARTVVLVTGTTPAKTGDIVTLDATTIGETPATGSYVEVTTAATAGLSAGIYKVIAGDSATGLFTIDAGNDTALDVTQLPLVSKITVAAAELNSRNVVAAGVFGDAVIVDSSRVQAVAGFDGPGNRTSATNGTYVVTTGVSNTVDKVLRLVSTAATAVSVNVTAWVDVNNNGVIDPTEYKSPTRTVNFQPVSATTFTTTLSALSIGQTTAAVATVDLGAAFNHRMMANAAQANRVNVRFQKNASATGESQVVATFDVPSGLLRAASTDTGAGAFHQSSPGLTVGTYNAQARYGTTLANVGAASFQTVAAGAVNITDTLGELQAAASANYSRASATTGNVRTGTTALTLATQVSESTGDARAGLPARVTVTRTVLAAGSTVAAGGKTLAATGVSSITYDATTNADGKVVVDLAATGARNDKVVVKVEVLDTAAWQSVENTLTWVNADIAGATGALIHLDTVGSNVHSVAKGGTLALRYFVRDTFGQPFAAAGYRLSFASSGGGAGGASITGTVPVVNGEATFNMVDNTVATTSIYTVTATLQKINAGGTAFDATSNTADVIVNVGTPAVATVSQTTAAQTTAIAEGSRTALQTVDLKSGDGRKINITPYAAGSYTVTGFVRAASGAPVPGQAVVISAPGAGISTVVGGGAADGIYGIGSLTVFSGADGSYTAYVFSNKSGRVDITVTSGAASTSTVALFNKPALTAGKTLVIDAPASVGQGSTLTVKATLVDKYGNGVDAATGNGLKITYSGPGLLVTTPTAFVDGALQFGVLLGANDSGVATVAISVYTGTDIIATSKSITIGTAGNVGAYSSWTKKLDDNSAKIYAKNVVGAGKVQFFLNGEEIAWVRATSAADSKLRSANGAAYLVRTVEFADGKNVLEVYVDGVRTTRTAYTK